MTENLTCEECGATGAHRYEDAWGDRVTVLCDDCVWSQRDAAEYDHARRYG